MGVISMHALEKNKEINKKDKTSYFTNLPRLSLNFACGVAPRLNQLCKFFWQSIGGGFDFAGVKIHLFTLT